jgi:GNAT superfamily N-acetyltransferase
MAARQAFAHYETFARLHTAGLSDLVHIQKFRERLPDEAGMGSDWWRKQILGQDRHVLVATECQLVVGIAILEHLPSAADARVRYLCVAPDARRRGIAQLLLQTLVGRARAEGAALVQMNDRGQADLGRSLLRAGFRQLGDGDWCFGLWDRHIAHSYSDLHIPEHEPVSPDEAAAQSLLLVMGTIDANMLLTPRARQIVQHELEGPCGRTGASELAFAAARRGFSVWLASVLRRVSACKETQRGRSASRPIGTDCPRNASLAIFHTLTFPCSGSRCRA